MKYHPTYSDYCCDSGGNMYRDGKLIKGTIASTGYRQYRIKGKTILGHRFVTECRIGRNLDTKEVVNHLNFNKLDNSEDNLEITTATGNNDHYWRNQEIDTSSVDFTSVSQKPSTGEKNGQSKLNNEEAKALILDLMAGMSNKEAAAKYGLHDRYVSLVRHKKRWKYLWLEMGLHLEDTKVSRPLSYN